MYGMPHYCDELKADLEAGRTVLGGCVVEGDSPAWHCNECEYRWGRLPRHEYDDPEDDMKFTLDGFKESLCDFAERHWKPSLRELAYQHILFHELSLRYPDQILVEIIVGTSTLRKALQKGGRALLKEYFPNKKTFCPDLILLDKKIGDCGERRFIKLDEFPDNLPLSAFVELKATSASPTAARMAYIRDTAKLQLLGDYWKAKSGHTPALIQVIFNWESGSRPALDPNRLQKWFAAPLPGRSDWIERSWLALPPPPAVIGR